MVDFLLTGNLNPEFSFEIFRFTISTEQLNFTKVRLEVYDHDSDDEDDFLGVVFIDLFEAGDFINNIITKWYPLLPQVNCRNKTELDNASAIRHFLRCDKNRLFTCNNFCVSRQKQAGHMAQSDRQPNQLKRDC